MRMIQVTPRKILATLLFTLLVGLSASVEGFAQRFDPIDFGAARCGDRICRTFAFRSENQNESVVDLFLADGSVFSQEPTLALPTLIPDGGSIDIGLCFSPDRAGIHTDTLFVLVSANGADPDTIPVDLSAFASGPGLGIDPLALEFPETDTGASSTMTVLLFNRGDEGVTLQASDFSDLVEPFSLADPSVLPITIPPGDTVELELRFSPLRQGASGVALAIGSGCGQEQELVLRGRSTLLIERGFGEVPCDEVLCDTLWVRATGPNDRLVALFMRDSTSFAIGEGGALPVAIPPGDSVGVPVCFAPSRRGNIVDSLYVIVRRGIEDERIGVRLSGTGIGPNVEISPPVLNFPRISAGTTTNLTTTLTNTGELPITFGAADLDVSLPFIVRTPLPVTIAPGESIDLDIEFAPTEQGIFSVRVDIQVGCTRILQLGLNGSTDFIGTGGVLRVTKIGFSPANDERVPCDFSQCTDVTLSNVGNATLIVESTDWADGSLGFVLNPPPATPLTIGANESTTVQVCINAQQAGTLRDTLVIASNDRRSIAFGLVIDESISMDTVLACGANSPTRLAEALKQAEIFVDNTLLYLPALGIQDQVAVTLYSGTPRFPSQPIVENVYPLTDVTDPTRAAAKASLATPITRGGTWTGAAVRSMIRTLAESPLPDRVIVLLTDGVASDNEHKQGYNPLDTIIKEANAENVRIFSIGLGIPEDDSRGIVQYIRDMSQQTRGLHSLANNCGSLQDAFARITEVVSQGGVWREPFQITVTAPQLIADDVRFDTLYIHDDSCMTLMLTNVGEGTAMVSDVQFTDLLGGATGEFYLEPGGNSFPINIPENGQRQVRVCFRPDGIRERVGQVRAVYNDCFAIDATGEIAGTGYAEANLRIDDERIALPGQIVTLPVYGDSALAGYDVNTIRWTLRWNRTMLELQGVQPGAAATGATVVQVGPVVESGSFASVELEATGPALTSPGELALLDFEFLRGDTLATLVEIVSGVMEDGNPKLLLKNAGIVIHDSICFRELRPITYTGPAPKLAIRSVSPMPGTGETINVGIETTGTIGFEVSIFSLAGEEIGSPERYGAGEGSNTLQLDVGALRSGTYYLRILDDGGGSSFRKIVISR